MMMIDRAVGLMTTVQDVVLRMMIDRVADSTKTAHVAATAALTTVRVAVSRMKKNRVVVARAMSARKTRCTTVRKPLAKSA
jgi:stringent starvation protein B